MNYEVNKEYTTSLVVLEEIKEPSLYQVVVHNDDFTPTEFVVSILERFFYMDRRRASDIMLEAHIKGKAACGLYPKDLAETITSQVIDYARANAHPLVCTVEAV
jgi:ATP-dependent Clp protease adaptor protein ClpS